MKSKLLIALVLVSMSANAYAMPAAVPAKWWDLMWARIEAASTNPGYCHAHPQSWIC